MRFVCLSQINPHLKNWPQIPVTEGLILLRDGSEWSGKWSKEKLHGPQLMQQINSPCRRAKSFRSLSRLPVHPLKLTWTGIRRFIKEKKPLGMLMGTVGCQGILSKAPWKHQGLSRLEYIWGIHVSLGQVYVYLPDMAWGHFMLMITGSSQLYSPRMEKKL